MFKPATMRLINLGNVAKAVGTLPLGVRIGGAVLITAGLVASVTGFVTYQVADGNGYDRGFEAGKTSGFESGKQEGLATSDTKRQEAYSGGYSAGKSVGYDEGYDVATAEALRVMQERLPPLLDLAFLAGKVSGSGSTRNVPTTFPSLDFGTNFHCESEINVFGDIETDCREGY